MSVSIGKSIAIAEGASSMASLGAVWLLGKNEKLIAPARDFIARRIVYPCEHCMGKPASGQNEGDWDETLMEKAKAKASVLLKGSLMLVVGAVAHVPTQLAMEGKWGDMKELRQVVLGKSLGVGATLMTGWLVEKAHPGTMGSLEGAVQHTIDLTLQEKNITAPRCSQNGDFCKLLVLDIPSSLCSGLVNYCFSRGRMH